MLSHIRELREAKGMTQFELVLASRTPQSLLSRLESGKLYPWPAVTRRLSEALQVPPEALFEEDAPK